MTGCCFGSDARRGCCFSCSCCCCCCCLPLLDSGCCRFSILDGLGPSGAASRAGSAGGWAGALGGGAGLNLLPLTCGMPPSSLLGLTAAPWMYATGCADRQTAWHQASSIDLTCRLPPLAATPPPPPPARTVCAQAPTLSSHCAISCTGIYVCSVPFHSSERSMHCLAQLPGGQAVALSPLVDCIRTSAVFLCAFGLGPRLTPSGRPSACVSTASST